MATPANIHGVLGTTTNGLVIVQGSWDIPSIAAAGGDIVHPQECLQRSGTGSITCAGGAAIAVPDGPWSDAAFRFSFTIRDAFEVFAFCRGRLLNASTDTSETNSTYIDYQEPAIMFDHFNTAGQNLNVDFVRTEAPVEPGSALEDQSTGSPVQLSIFLAFVGPLED